MKIAGTPPVGHIIAYEFLWRSQSDSREDGQKTYPAAVVLCARESGEDIVYVLAMSHSPPQRGQGAISVPLKLKRHLGLDDKPS